MEYPTSYLYIPLTNRVRGPYCKLRTEFFSVRLYGPSAKRAGHKFLGDFYSTDRENEVNKIFIISLRLIGRKKKKFSKLAGRTVKYGPQN